MKTTTTPYPGAEVADGPLKGLFYHSENGMYHRFVKTKDSHDIAVYVDKNLVPNFTQNYVAKPPRPFNINDHVHTIHGSRIGKIIMINRDEGIATIKGLDEAASRASTAAKYMVAKIDDLVHAEDCPC